MVTVAQLLPPDGIQLHLKAYSLESAIEQVSALAAEMTGLRSSVINDALIGRARLGAGVGDGVVIPHARIQGLPRTLGFFARPLNPIVYDHGAPITLIFVLLTPVGGDGAHLQALAKIAGVLRNPESRNLLETGDRAAIHAMLGEL